MMVDLLEHPDPKRRKSTPEDEEMTIFPRVWAAKYLDKSGVSKDKLEEAALQSSTNPLRIWGACEGMGTSAYVMRHISEVTGIEHQLLFSSEILEGARDVCLRHHGWQHFFTDVTEDQSGGYCHTCETKHEEGIAIGESEMAMMGIPCPLFSVLNQRTKNPGWNPFLEPSSSVVRICLQKIRARRPKTFLIEEVASLMKRFEQPVQLQEDSETYAAPIDAFLRGRAGDQVLGVMCELDDGKFYHVKVLMLKSSDFGSPNHRRRCYILGVRSDIGDERTLRKLGHWIQKECASVHTRCTLTQCWDYCVRNGSTLSMPAYSRDQGYKSKESEKKQKRLLRDLDVAPGGWGPYCKGLSRQGRGMLNTREKVKLDVEFKRLEVAGIDPRDAFVDVARSSINAMGSYPGGLGAAFCCQMKLWHLGRHNFLPAEALLAGQGVDCRDMVYTERDYRLYNLLAGNAMTSSVLGACVMGLTLTFLAKDAEGRPLMPLDASMGSESDSSSSCDYESSSSSTSDGEDGEVGEETPTGIGLAVANATDLPLSPSDSLGARTARLSEFKETDAEAMDSGSSSSSDEIP